MAATPVTPVPALNSQVVTGNAALNVFGPNPNGGYLQNPVTAADQGLGAAEDLIVNPVTAAVAPGVTGGVNGTNFRIPPGEAVARRWRRAARARQRHPCLCFGLGTVLHVGIRQLRVCALSIGVEAVVKALKPGRKAT